MRSSLFFIVVTTLLVGFRVQASLKQSEFGPKIRELVEILHTTCILRSGTYEESINKVINGVFTDEPKIKAYMKCLLIEGGVMDEKGEFNMEMLTQLIPPKILEEALKIIKICDTKTKGMANVEDKAFTFLKCFYDLNPDIFLFF